MDEPIVRMNDVRIELGRDLAEATQELRIRKWRGVFAIRVAEQSGGALHRPMQAANIDSLIHLALLEAVLPHRRYTYAVTAIDKCEAEIANVALFAADYRRIKLGQHQYAHTVSPLSAFAARLDGKRGCGRRL
jgi:hypothetical protein